MMMNPAPTPSANRVMTYHGRVSNPRRRRHLVHVTRVSTYEVLVSAYEDPIDVFMDTQPKEIEQETLDMRSEQCRRSK